MATKKKDASVEDLGYAEALQELEEILSELERPDVDVDVLADRVERASALIRLCRDRIGNARLQIDSVVDGLSGEQP
ncbi:MAG: exodeoxyribonuclease small subunit [Actinomycetota bacterium]|jgi:exodeoxyribonuclease VII small subunit